MGWRKFLAGASKGADRSQTRPTLEGTSPRVDLVEGVPWMSYMARFQGCPEGRLGGATLSESSGGAFRPLAVVLESGGSLRPCAVT